MPQAKSIVLSFLCIYWRGKEGKISHADTMRDPYTSIFYIEVNLINEPLVIFVCATTGQGDPPDNMKVRFSEYL